jgi:hypothetical protein
MPYVSGFLRIRKRGEGGGRPGRPDQELPDSGGDGDTDPGWGVDEGDKPEVSPPDIRPPPGVWPPPTVGHPIHPIAPGGQHPDQGLPPPPGAVWPPIPEGVQGKFVVLAYIPDHGWHYIVVDGGARWPDGRPGRPQPEHPDYPGGRPEQQPGQRPAQPQQR